MELVEAINKRKTTRGFKTDPVPLEILQNIMTTALRAPSWGNTQPWEFAIASSKTLEQIKQKKNRLPICPFRVHSPSLCSPGFQEDLRHR